MSCTCHGYRLTNQDDCFLVAFDHSRGELLFEEALVMTRIGSKPNHHNKNLTKLRMSKFLYNTLCLYLKNNIIIFGGEFSLVNGVSFNRLAKIKEEIQQEIINTTIPPGIIIENGQSTILSIVSSSLKYNGSASGTAINSITD